MRISKYQRVWDFSGAFSSDAYASDEGHSWDRLACIAGEYERGELSWSDARRLIADTTADAERAYAALTSESE